ncbi:receptor-like protein 6 [Tripterygium wilfordii]|uniref:receptor-like protein 6 n=1 Tax=Tripterygium wilfordii TaxID=458696 RepID=UPI0018F7E8D7|nr:receptor-like protein 6 [Tripterygium wilfordii]
MIYPKIPNAFVVIDLSSNKFEGGIPESIATLKKLQSLNLSNNHLSGRIPSLIENLTDLESLVACLALPLHCAKQGKNVLLHLIITMAASSQKYSSGFLTLLVLASSFLPMHVLTSTPPPCHRDESFALLQFSQSFVLDRSASFDLSAHPKVISWNQHGGNGDCCLWDGVECDENTGHVIYLDLSSSWLYGSISSNSSLFNLVHLQRLNLADNDFNHSQIPSEFRYLSQLTYLNLTSSGFHGQIPSEISHLTRLTSLDLTGSVDEINGRLLELTGLGLERLVQNLTHIEELYLDNVDISSAVPSNIANLSALTSLHLGNCGLLGRFPNRIFELPNLQDLNMGMNENLLGYLPEFQRSSPLKILWLESTNFSGQIPASIGNLHSLTTLNFALCNIGGQLPYSLGNLTNLSILRLKQNHFFGQIPSSFANLTKLTNLTLSNSNLTCGSLSWLGEKTKLTLLGIGKCSINGEIPHVLANLSRLDALNLQSTNLSGRIPHWLANLTRLTALSLENNELQGPIPASISKLVNLEQLALERNQLTGIIDFDLFFSLENLVDLGLSYNNFSMLNETSPNATLPKWRNIALASCNLREFPNFLRYQHKMAYLDLVGNNIHGKIPSWLWNTGRETLWHIALGYNFLTGFEGSPPISSLSNLKHIGMEFNQLQGPLPIPPPSIIEYFVFNNSLSGEMPIEFCNLPNLFSLDVSFNHLNGTLPRCLFNLGNSMNVLNLKCNYFHGSIPEASVNGSNLRMIDLSQNEFQGRIPISLANHTMLWILNLGDNQICDTFPSWLGALPKLQVLILRSNKLFGEIGRPASNVDFSMLRIIDLSNNHFTGILPSEYFQIWNDMRAFEEKELSYMEASIPLLRSDYWTFYYIFNIQLALVNKGRYMIYPKIPNAFVVIDLSSNKFEGGIPESIATLKKLQSLNLSNNHLSGRIPSLIGNLTDLESLDLSNNMLLGEIPPQLTQLTFLSFFNVSQNNLSGHIPQGKQFGTFENNSFEGNMGLCGKPLSKTCGNVGESPPLAPTNEDDENSGGSSVYIQWMIIAIGYGSGLVVGLIFGRRFTTWKHEWFVETFSRRQRKRRQIRRRQITRGRQICCQCQISNLEEISRFLILECCISYSLLVSLAVVCVCNQLARLKTEAVLMPSEFKTRLELEFCSLILTVSSPGCVIAVQGVPDLQSFIYFS